MSDSVVGGRFFTEMISLLTFALNWSREGCVEATDEPCECALSVCIVEYCEVLCVSANRCVLSDVEAVLNYSY